MADVHSVAVRSYNMSKIRAKDTKPEMVLRKHLFSLGLRYRLHSAHLPGKPDLVFSRYKTVVFIHGCFWHGHDGCRYFVIPKTRTDWWLDKIRKNKERDNESVKKLRRMGWKILVVHECELKGPKTIKTFKKIERQIKSGNTSH
jgi:DNA mismatch endonuclease, patch repair protein